MSDNTNEPVAEVPGSSENLVNPASNENATTTNASKRRVSPWILGIATAVVAGASGFGIATVAHDGPLDRTAIHNVLPGGKDGNHMGPDGHRGGKGNKGPMGPHCEDQSGIHAPVNADGSCPTGFTLDERGGKGNKGPMGPHCEDQSGIHAPVNADGSCPIGFTLDERGGDKAMLGDDTNSGTLVSPTPSASSSIS